MLRLVRNEVPSEFPSTQPLRTVMLAAVWPASFFFFAGYTSFYLICGMSVLILAVGWAYAQICRIYPDGGGVYTAAKHRSRIRRSQGSVS